MVQYNHGAVGPFLKALLLNLIALLLWDYLLIKNTSQTDAQGACKQALLKNTAPLIASLQSRAEWAELLDFHRAECLSVLYSIQLYRKGQSAITLAELDAMWVSYIIHSWLLRVRDDEEVFWKNENLKAWTLSWKKKKRNSKPNIKCFVLSIWVSLLLGPQL